MLKQKIINDPVFGFIDIPNDFILEITQHAYFQRLNRIKQLGLSSFVYPGAQHTRLLHSIGAMHLMGEAIAQLRAMGQHITLDEENAARTAILLHDIGHAPFSHALESALFQQVEHEEISLQLMKLINDEMGGKLDLAIKIFQNEYEKHFLHQLVSSQLDTDRLDYLSRDSFFCGVSEGMVGSARIIKMLDVRDNHLVVQEKGIYSVEKFLVARRLMFWQVYLHKTSLGAEKMLINILQRAKELKFDKKPLIAAPAIDFFLKNDIGNGFLENEIALDFFVKLDDYDIFSAIKIWTENPDFVLSTLCKSFINRRLYKTDSQRDISINEKTEYYTKYFSEKFGITADHARYFVGAERVATDTYSPEDDRINILYKDGRIADIAAASDMLNIQVLTKKVEKEFFWYYKI